MGEGRSSSPMRAPAGRAVRRRLKSANAQSQRQTRWSSADSRPLDVSPSTRYAARAVRDRLNARRPIARRLGTPTGRPRPWDTSQHNAHGPIIRVCALVQGGRHVRKRPARRWRRELPTRPSATPNDNFNPPQAANGRYAAGNTTGGPRAGESRAKRLPPRTRRSATPHPAGQDANRRHKTVTRPPFP
jgi:hypothetical protein